MDKKGRRRDREFFWRTDFSTQGQEKWTLVWLGNTGIKNTQFPTIYISSE